MSDFYDRNTELFRETGVRPVVPSAETEEDEISAVESVITAEGWEGKCRERGSAGAAAGTGR